MDSPQRKKIKSAPAKFKSKVWTHFGFPEDTKDKRVVCKQCFQYIPYSGGTTNLFTHLRRHHPELNTEFKVEPGTSMNLTFPMIENIE